MADSKYVGAATSDPTLSGAVITASTIGSSLIGTTSADTVGFFGATKTTQPTSANEAAVVSTAATTAAGYGFATAGQANGIITLVNQIRADLVTLGLIKGS